VDTTWAQAHCQQIENDMSKNKNVTVKVRMKIDEKKKLQAFADRSLVSMSDIIRISLDKHMKGVYGI